MVSRLLSLNLPDCRLGKADSTCLSKPSGMLYFGPGASSLSFEPLFSDRGLRKPPIIEYSWPMPCGPFPKPLGSG